MTLPDDSDADNPPSWLYDEAPPAEPDDYPSWQPPDTPAPQTIEVTELVAEPRASFDLEAIRAAAPPVIRRAIDRLVVGTFHPEAAAELREMAGALKVPGLEAVIDQGLQEWERRHPPKQGRNGKNGKHAAGAKEPAAPVDVLAGSLWSETVDAIIAWGRLPTVPIMVPTADRGGQELLRLKPGSIIELIGGTGAGKTSLALEISRCHALWQGASAFFGLELDVPTTGARLVGQHQGVSWLDAASLPVDVVRAAMNVPKAHVFGRMSLADVEKRLEALKARYPNDVILAVIDYAQILQDDMTERLQFAAVLERLRLIIQRTMVIAILTSQGSRGSSATLRSGEALGADTTTAGAESAQLERMAWVTLALGNMGEDDGHGWRTIDLNIGKSRMGTGDVVVPMRTHGASGRFAHAGEAEKASEVRARRISEKAEAAKKSSNTRDDDRVVAYMKNVMEPISRRRVEDDLGGKRDNIRAAFRRLIDARVVMEVGTPPRPGYLPPVILSSNLHTERPQRPPAAPERPLSAEGRYQTDRPPGPYVVGRGPVDASDRGAHQNRQGSLDQWGRSNEKDDPGGGHE